MTITSQTLGTLITAQTACNLASITDHTLYKHLKRSQVKRYLVSWDKRLRLFRVSDLEDAFHKPRGSLQQKLTSTS